MRDGPGFRGLTTTLVYSSGVRRGQQARKVYMAKAQEAESLTIAYERTVKSGPEKEVPKVDCALQM